MEMMVVLLIVAIVAAASAPMMNKKAIEKVAKETEIVYNALVAVGRAVTASELIAETDLSALENESGVVSTQKVSAMFKKLKEQGKVESYTDKKKTYFKVVG